LRYPFHVIWLVLWLVPKIAMTAPVVRYADITVQVDKQQLKIVDVKPGRFDKPTALPRYRGRFAARAVAGDKILEEVRLDLPLLADAETNDVSDDDKKFAERLRQGVSVKARVRVPLPEGADAIVIVDQKSGRSARVSLATAPAPGAAKDAPPGR
jgi:hypothetical protein